MPDNTDFIADKVIEKIMAMGKEELRRDFEANNKEGVGSILSSIGTICFPDKLILHDSFYFHDGLAWAGEIFYEAMVMEETSNQQSRRFQHTERQKIDWTNAIESDDYNYFLAA